MTKHLSLAIMTILAVLVFAGCSKKDNNSSTTTTTSTPFMKFTVGTGATNTTYNVSGASAAYSGGSSSGGMSFIYIYGIASKQSVKITLINNSGTPGTTAIGTGDAAAEYAPYGLDSTYSYAVSGSVTITADSPNIVGTFNFVCADSTRITNGSFSVIK